MKVSQIDNIVDNEIDNIVNPKIEKPIPKDMGPLPPEPEDSNVQFLTLEGLYKKKYEGYFYDQDSFFDSRLVSTFNFENFGNYQITNIGGGTTQTDWSNWGFVEASQYDKPEALGLPFPSVGKGVIYFGGPPPENAGTASVGPVLVSEEVTSQIDDSYSQAAGQNNKSLIIKGYFKPTINGVYKFRLYSDDASYLWLGTNAFDGNRTMNNSVVSLPGLHGPYYSEEGTFTMTANSYYPLTVEFGNGPEGEGVLIFEYMPPGSTEWASNLAGKLFHDITAKGNFIPFQASPALTVLYDNNNNVLDFISGNIPASWKEYLDISGYLTIGTSAIEIGPSAFTFNRLNSIMVPNSTEIIGDFSFDRNLISTLNIPSGVTQIGIDAFSRNQITSLTLPVSGIGISAGAFRNNLLTSVNLPIDLEVISMDSFRNNLLTSINIPNSVTQIESNAFSSNKITLLTIPSGVIGIGLNAFSSNTGLSVVNSYIPLSSFNSSVFPNTFRPLTIFTRFDDNTWTSGTGLSLLGNNNVTVIKSLNELGAEAITVSGAGASGINGIYTLRGTGGGKPFYNKVNTNTDFTTNSIYWNNNQWTLHNVAGDIYYQSTDNTSFPWQSPSWIPNSGSLPVPIFTKRSLPSIVIAETDVIEIKNFPLGNGVYTKGFDENIGYYYIRDDGNYYVWKNYAVQKWAFASLTNDLILCDANEDPSVFIPNSEWRFTSDNSMAPLKLLGVG